MLKIDNVSKSFGDKSVLVDFSASIEEGATVLITGTSGAGKTTLLRIIAGLENADSGSISLPGNGTISLMFQEPRLFPWMSVLDNVTAVLPKADTSAATSLLAKLGIGGESSARPSELSGGMQRRVALARTLIFPADVYLFDEPFAGLDPDTARTVASVILEHTIGKTVLIVSHDRSMLPDSIGNIIIEKRV